MFRPTTSDNRDTHDRGNSGGDPSRPSDGVRRTVPEPIYVNSIGMRFVPISPGTFTMGENETARKVTMGRAFHLGEYQVTQEQYEKVMGSNRNHSAYKGPQKPVENVAWAEAVEFCCKLSDSPDEKTAESVYRLPTEAEWEYACRAGTTTQYSFGDSDSKLGKYAWYSGNSSNTTHPVGQKKSNAWGLYDMHGNVQEWCQDYHEDDVTGDAVIDSTSPAKRLARGGSWNHSSAECRSTYPIQHDPDGRGPDLGFRVLRSSIR